MRCGMCEMHVEDTVRRSLQVKKVKASRIKNSLVVITPKDYVLEDFNKVIDLTGYKVISYEKSKAKKGLLAYK